MTLSLVLQTVFSKMSMKYPSGVRGYHYYCNYWQPEAWEELDCMHERDKAFDFLAIKVIKKITGETARHLPMENLRITESQRIKNKIADDKKWVWKNSRITELQMIKNKIADDKKSNFCVQRKN